MGAASSRIIFNTGAVPGHEITGRCGSGRARGCGRRGGLLHERPLCAAAHRPERVKATASFYGVRLITDKPNSPHLLAKGSPAEFYIACAETDHWVTLDMVERLQQELAGSHGEVELYSGVEHGFAFPQRAVYDKTAAEQHWERVLTLFRRRLC